MMSKLYFARKEAFLTISIIFYVSFCASRQELVTNSSQFHLSLSFYNVLLISPLPKVLFYLVVMFIYVSNFSSMAFIKQLL